MQTSAVIYRGHGSDSRKSWRGVPVLEKQRSRIGRFSTEFSEQALATAWSISQRARLPSWISSGCIFRFHPSRARARGGIHAEIALACRVGSNRRVRYCWNSAGDNDLFLRHTRAPDRKFNIRWPECWASDWGLLRSGGQPNTLRCCNCNARALSNSYSHISTPSHAIEGPALQTARLLLARCGLRACSCRLTGLHA